VCAQVHGTRSCISRRCARQENAVCAQVRNAEARLVWCDDSQVCSVRKVKRWAGVGETPGMKITVWEMES